MINLTTLAAVKSLLEEVGASFDDQLLQRIEEVSFRVQTVYDVDLEMKTHIEVHDGGTRRLYVRNPPIISITSIKHDTTFQYDDGELLDPLNYAIVNNGWDVAYSPCFPFGQNSIQIEYISGYVDALDVNTTVPLWLQSVVAKQVAYEFQHRKSEGLSNVDFPDGAIVKENRDFLRSVVTSLNTLRKYKIG